VDSKKMREDLWNEISREYIENDMKSATFGFPELGDPERDFMFRSFKYFEEKGLLKVFFTSGACTYDLKAYGIDFIEKNYVNNKEMSMNIEIEDALMKPIIFISHMRIFLYHVILILPSGR